MELFEEKFKDFLKEEKVPTSKEQLKDIPLGWFGGTDHNSLLGGIAGEFITAYSVLDKKSYNDIVNDFKGIPREEIEEEIKEFLDKLDFAFNNMEVTTKSSDEIFKDILNQFKQAFGDDGLEDIDGKFTYQEFLQQDEEEMVEDFTLNWQELYEILGDMYPLILWAYTVEGISRDGFSGYTFEDDGEYDLGEHIARLEQFVNRDLYDYIKKHG